MNYSAVYHRAGMQYCYPKNQDELIINLKTGYDVLQVFIVYGDPYEAGIAGSASAWNGKKEEIYFKKDLQYQRWWTTTIRPEYKRLKYYFILKTKEEEVYYFENGFLTREQEEQKGRMLQYFIFPWMNSSDIGSTPEWVSQTIWYQIFPDRFCSGGNQKKSRDILPWREEGSVTNEEFFGGDLEGILSKLDYLQQLGITGIYLTPIFEAPSAHKYDTKDYYKIDPDFGDQETFRKLVEEAHRRGMKIMLDMVFNHSGALFPKWQDVLERGSNSGYYDWFMINHWPIEKNIQNTRDGSFYSFAFDSNMPKLNTNNEETASYLINICRYWVEQFQVDGLRFDVGNEISHTFLRRVRRELKAENPDLYLLGEIWHDAGEWLRGDEYDGVMNYPLTESINDFWVDSCLAKQEFAYMVNRSYTMYQEQNNQALFNLLDSHDTDRLFTRSGLDEDAFYQQLTILFTMPGSPCIFYGTEIAMEGSHDPDCRRCMPWDKIKKGEYNGRIRTMQQLIGLRKENPCFTSPYFHFPSLYDNKRLIEYEKLTADGEKVVIYLNCSEKVESLDVKDIVFSRKYEEKYLEPGGILIHRK